ncbi:MAG: AMP-binding protein [Anaerolineaceae bacterium]|nr:AMP-binding protein [Anaerolineaceae bacterium]
MKNGIYPYYEIPEIEISRQLVEYGKQSNDDKPFLYTKTGGSITSAEFSDLVKECATYLLSEGLRKANIGLLGENSNEWCLAYFSIINSGNVVVPLDRNLNSEEIVGLLERCECKAVIYSEKDKDLIAKADREKVKFLSLNEIDAYCEKGRSLLKEGDRSYEETIIDKDDLAAIVFTSGTSGTMKGVMLSQKNLMSDAVACCRHVVEHDTQIFLPLHHTFPWAAAMFGIFLCGGTMRFSPNMKRLMKDLKNNHPQNISAVPLMVETLYNGIWNSARKNGQETRLKKAISLSRFLMAFGIDARKKLFKEIHDSFGGKLEVIICGGAPLDEDVERGFYDLGIQVINGYGITECSPVVAVNRPHDFRFGSVGKVLPCNKVRIIDPDKDGIGEVLVKGSNVMKGYYKDPEATAEAFEDEWFRTGDFGKIDKDGFLFITGRKKNLIVLSNGENVSPEEIENKLIKLPYVKEVAVYEEDREIVGEFYLDEDAFSEARKMLENDVDFYNRSVPNYKNIGKIKVRTIPFEKTTTMKIKRYLLKKEKEEESTSS